MSKDDDFLKFEKGMFKRPSLEDLLGKLPEKETKTELDEIEEALTLRRKMAETSRHLAKLLEKPTDHVELSSVGSQLAKLQGMFDRLSKLNHPF
ncbi:hypothetical protein D3C72_1717450 [compost metagenome]